MAYKRSRATFEADLQLQQSPYVVFGTPLPPLDPDTRDDGSYVPVWKQEVTDEQGRKRLHGAFTGGFSAGYFNTVGSKEGWTPSQFISSRANRKKDAPTPQQKPEDFMDEEDIADAEESRKLQTADSFAGLGSAAEERSQKEPVMDILKTTGETMGVKLLRKMGWRDGQGIGPKVKRKARLDEEDDPGGGESQETHLFAPENSQMISFVRKYDRKGLGFEGEGRLGDAENTATDSTLKGERERETSIGTNPKNTKMRTKQEPRGGFGVGILNDNGSDDEDPYHIGPQISYNRIIGADKKKKKKPENGKKAANPLLSTKPIFISKKASASKASSAFRRCHDGRLPLDGFVLSQSNDRLADSPQENKYPPPTIPSGWKSSKTPANPATSAESSQNYQSTATVAKASTLDPKSRASILGETALPGKSIFDYLSPSARSRIVSAAKNPNLPPALNEAHSALPPASPHALIPPLSPTTAHAALKRGTAGWTPYADDSQKLSRYRIFLETRASLHPPGTLPPRAPGASTDEWVKEMHEFAHAAQIFRPVSGLMATRFTTSSSTPNLASDPSVSQDEPSLLTRPAEKVQDPAMQAAAIGMYGPLTRSVVEFFPTRLLCKRFNVQPPAHVAADPASAPHSHSGSTPDNPRSSALPQRRLELVGAKDVREMVRERDLVTRPAAAGGGGGGGGGETQRDLEGEGEAEKIALAQREGVIVDPDRNEALERERPGDAVFRAVFGSDSESGDE